MNLRRGKQAQLKKGTGLRLPLSRGPSLPSWLSPDRNHLVDPGPPRSTQEALRVEPSNRWGTCRTDLAMCFAPRLSDLTTRCCGHPAGLRSGASDHLDVPHQAVASLLC